VDETATAEAGEAAEGWLLHVRPHAGAMLNGGEPLLLLREVASLGGECILCDTANVPPLDLLVPGQGYLGWTFRMPAHVDEAEARDIFDFVGDDCSIAIGNDAAIPAPRIEALAGGEREAGCRIPIAAGRQRPGGRCRRYSRRGVSGGCRRADHPHRPGQARPADRSVGELVIAQAMVAQRMANQEFPPARS
jgi:two-component system chemotaxis sensor kinase CheA